jgi:tRNA-dihydrouridine synthase
MYKGEANWEWIGKVKNHPDMVIPVFGNGDIDSPEKALKMKELYNVDGVMIGRAAIGFPWIFQQIKHFKLTGEHLPDPDLAERARICKKHLEFSLQWKNEILAIVEMRRHYANYFKGIPNFKPIRLQLVTENSPLKVLEILQALMDGSLAPADDIEKIEPVIPNDYSEYSHF